MQPTPRVCLPSTATSTIPNGADAYDTRDEHWVGWRKAKDLENSKIENFTRLTENKLPAHFALSRQGWNSDPQFHPSGTVQVQLPGRESQGVFSNSRFRPNMPSRGGKKHNRIAKAQNGQLSEEMQSSAPIQHAAREPVPAENREDSTSKIDEPDVAFQDEWKERENRQDTPYYGEADKGLHGTLNLNSGLTQEDQDTAPTYREAGPEPENISKPDKEIDGTTVKSKSEAHARSSIMGPGAVTCVPSGAESAFNGPDTDAKVEKNKNEIPNHMTGDTKLRPVPVLFGSWDDTSALQSLLWTIPDAASYVPSDPIWKSFTLQPIPQYECDKASEVPNQQTQENAKQQKHKGRRRRQRGKTRNPNRKTGSNLAQLSLHHELFEHRTDDYFLTRKRKMQRTLSFSGIIGNRYHNSIPCGDWVSQSTLQRTR